MSEQNTEECSLCGRDGGSFQSCGICHGGAPNQSKSYTLADHRAGRAPSEDRYGDDGGLNPKTSPLVVGGAINHPNHRQN